jgi:hypothetical protein
VYLNLTRWAPEILQGLKLPSSEDDRLLAQLVPSFVREAVLAGKERVLLPPALTTHLRRKQGTEGYGISYVRRGFDAVAAKRIVQLLDRATIEGLISRLIILQLGTDDSDSPYHVPDPKRVDLLNALLRNPSPSMLLAWAGKDLSIIDLSPTSEILNFANRYDASDDAISAALGVPRLLIDGRSSGTDARDWSAFIATMVKLEVFRQQVLAKLNVWARELAVANGFDDEFPELRWRQVNLRDERALKALVIKAFEDSLMGRTDTLRELGWDPEIIIDNQLQEATRGLSERIGTPPVSFSTPRNGSFMPKNLEGRPDSQLTVEPERAAVEPVVAMSGSSGRRRSRRPMARCTMRCGRRRCSMRRCTWPVRWGVGCLRMR